MSEARDTNETPETSESRETLRETFDTAAALYQHARPTYPSALFDALIEIAELAPGDRLLEIGCGPGVATLPLLRRGLRNRVRRAGREPGLARMSQLR